MRKEASLSYASTPVVFGDEAYPSDVARQAPCVGYGSGARRTGNALFDQHRISGLPMVGLVQIARAVIASVAAGIFGPRRQLANLRIAIFAGPVGTRDTKRDAALLLRIHLEKAADQLVQRRSHHQLLATQTATEQTTNNFPGNF